LALAATLRYVPVAPPADRAPVACARSAGSTGRPEVRLRIASRPAPAVAPPDDTPTDPPAEQPFPDPPDEHRLSDPRDARQVDGPVAAGDAHAPVDREPVAIAPPPPPPLLLAGSDLPARLPEAPPAGAQARTENAARPTPPGPPDRPPAGPSDSVNAPEAPDGREASEAREAPSAPHGQDEPVPERPDLPRDERIADASGAESPSDAAATRPAEPAVEIRPRYPRSSVRRGLEGLAVVAARVGADGVVRSVRLLRSSGHARLDRAALSAVGAARFRPALRDGEAIASVVHVPIRFRLR
jgi:protein TonB